MVKVQPGQWPRHKSMHLPHFSLKLHYFWMVSPTCPPQRSGSSHCPMVFWKRSWGWVIFAAWQCWRWNLQLNSLSSQGLCHGSAHPVPCPLPGGWSQRLWLDPTVRTCHWWQVLQGYPKSAHVLPWLPLPLPRLQLGLCLLHCALEASIRFCPLPIAKHLSRLSVFITAVTISLLPKLPLYPGGSCISTANEAGPVCASDPLGEKVLLYKILLKQESA